MFKHDFAQERKCPVCGKTFMCADIDQWVYKRSDGHKRIALCSWHCMRELERTMGRKRNYTRRV